MPGHSHSHAYTGKRVFWVALLKIFITLAEAVGGIISGSLALLSDAVHNLSDTAAVVLSYIANKIAGRAKDAKMTYGYKERRSWRPLSIPRFSWASPLCCSLKPIGRLRALRSSTVPS